MTFFEEKKNWVEFGQSTGVCTEIMGRLYADVAQIPTPNVLIGYPIELARYASLLAMGMNSHIHLTNPHVIRELYCGPDRKDQVIIGYSGGKDSLAAAIICAEAGMHPTLFHIRGLNKSYPNEADLVIEAAEATQFSTIIKSAKLHGKTDYKENPTKDQLILAMMVDYGCQIGINRFSMGIERTNKLAESNILYNWSDAFEMFMAIAPLFQKVMPAYRWDWHIKNHTHSLKTIVGRDRSLLNHTISCLLPFRFQASRKEANEKRFGISLPRNRCGSCWKCCVEYLNLLCLCDDPANDGYARHCVKIFLDNIHIAYGDGYKPGATSKELLKSAVDPEFTDMKRLEQYV